MLLAGSLAKGTALRSLNDIDVACYISGADAPHDVIALLTYLAERLRKAYPNFSPDQVQPQTYSVTVSFRGSGLDVDVVPGQGRVCLTMRKNRESKLARIIFIR